MQSIKAALALALVALLCLVTDTHALYTSKGPVKLLDAKGVREMQKDSGVWLVEFYAPWCGHCKNLAPEWKKAAKALEGVVNVAAVDCDQHKELAGQFGVQGFPTIKIFGADKKAPTDYQGARSAAGIVDAALAESRKLVKARLSGGGKDKKTGGKKPSASSKPAPESAKARASDVVTLTDANFDELVLHSGDVWLVEFYAPWCGHCKALAPEWEQAASELKGSVKLGALDATAHEAKAAEYAIRGFPTIKLFGPAAAGAADAKDYNGPRTAAGIAEFALQALEALGGEQQLPEVHSSETLNAVCAGKASCVLAVLPPLADGGKAAREAYLATVLEAARAVRGKPFRFAWLEGGAQPALEAQFGLTFGYPSLLALNAERRRFVVQRGAFAADAIGAFLARVLQGKEPSAGFEALPALEAVAPWDGGDAPAAPEAADDDDDDDILSEILGGSDAKDEL